MMKVGIIDGKYGNIRSVYQAFDYLDTNPSILETPKNIDDFNLLILPGVGTFENCMNGLKKGKWDTAIKKAVQKGTNILGICVGMQVLMNKGFEFGEHEGLGLIDGECHSIAPYREDCKTMPHIGWAETHFTDSEMGSDFYYFNHSFVCAPTDLTCVAATASHAKQWPVFIQKNNISGIQCHPEKSHNAGLKFLKYFLSNIS